MEIIKYLDAKIVRPFLICC